MIDQVCNSGLRLIQQNSSHCPVASSGVCSAMHIHSDCVATPSYSVLEQSVKHLVISSHVTALDICWTVLSSFLKNMFILCMLDGEKS